MNSAADHTLAVIRGGLRAALCALAVLLLFAGCRDGGGGGPAGDALRDPSSRGPYAVGLQRLTFERTADDGTPRPLDTWIWYPAEGSPSAGATDNARPASGGAPYPIVIFSHGSGGRPELQRYFTEHLASWGYVVVAPPHPGNTSDDCVICGVDAILKSAPQRPEDVKFVLDAVVALREDPASDLGAIIDPDLVAIAGHSFGGWTAIFVATDERFDAAIAMAPGAPQTLVGHAVNIRIPVLIFASEMDTVVEPPGVRQLAEAIPAATALTYVSFPAGTHLAFIDNCFTCNELLPAARGHELTDLYATAFLEFYLRGDARYAPYLAENIGIDALVETR